MDNTREENKLEISNNEENIKKQVRSLIGKLKRRTAYFFDIPEELRLNSKIVQVERELGVRRTTRKGYNILNKAIIVV